MLSRTLAAGGLVALAALLTTSALAGGQAEKHEMDLIISEANADVCEHDFSSAKATIRIRERRNGTTRVKVRVRNAKPDHLYTMWLKLASASPLTAAGATPAAGTDDIEGIIDAADSDSADGANAFYTNARGNGTLRVTLDFHLSDGVYPFSDYDEELADVDIGHTPFTFRVISHCTDHEQHGLVPGTHEPTFQISLP